MVIKYIIAMLCMVTLYSQSVQIDQKTKQKLIESGVSIKEAQRILELQGITQEQINSELKKNNAENVAKDTRENPDIIKKKVDEVFEMDKSISKDELLGKENDSIEEVKEEDDEEIDKDTSVDEDKEVKISKSITTTSNYFGLNIFQGDPEIFQKSLVGNVDSDYPVGPGDEIIIMLWGETQFNRNYTVTRDGYIFITDYGQVFVNGLTLSKLEQKLFRLLKKVYASLDPKTGDATTFIDVTLGATVLRPLRVFVLGEVSRPGAYEVKPSTSLFTSLYYFNGPTNKGSLRNIRLLRKGKEKAKIDFYDYLLSGKQVNDVRLQRDDVVFIPSRGKTVNVSGEIKREAIYELKEGEGLKELIEIAGGLTATTYINRIQIDRIIPSDQRIDLGMDRTIIDVDLKEILSTSQDFDLYDGDKIEFFKISEIRQNIVTINGSVNRPGIYDLGNGLTLLELIQKTDGLIGNTYMERVDIVRSNTDFTQTQLDVNLRSVLNNDTQHNIQLAPNDVVTIYNLSDMIYKTDVSISGHVKSPGDKPFRQGMQVYDLIFMGGGFENELHLNNTYFERAELVRLGDDGFTREIISFRLDSVLAGKGIAKMELKMGDGITIYSLTDVKGEKENTVSIKGYVKKPGIYQLYQENMTLYDLLFMAGGFDDIEHFKTTYIDRAELIRYGKSRSYSGKKKRRIIPFNVDLVLSGEGISGILLQPGDEIRIYSLDEVRGEEENSVIIEGHVKRPGTYPLAEENMMLSDLLFMAGGFEDKMHLGLTFLDRADLIRNSQNKTTQTINPFKLSEVLNNHDSELNVKLVPGDFVRIYSTKMFNLLHTVSIEGIISEPGQYSLKAQMTLKDLILEAGGVTSDIYRYRVEVARIDPSNLDEDIFAEIITVDLNNDFSVFKIGTDAIKPINSLGQNRDIEFFLEPYDLITVRPDPYFSRQRKVTIQGLVYYPGDYVLRGPNELVTDIIERAGGLRPEAYPNASELTREGSKISLSFDDIIRNPKSKLNFELVDGDLINIGSRPNLVIINGEINTPGNYQYLPGKRLDNYIKMAGGFTKDAARFATFIRYPNGTSKAISLFKFSPVVLDGSIITVGKKEEIERFNLTEYVTNLTTFWADLSQAWLLIILAMRA